MPEYTSKLEIPLPLGNEYVKRENRRAELQAIEQNAALDPFILKSAVYDSANDKIDVTIGKGKAAFLGTLVSKTSDTVVSITSPVANTDYYIYINSDGTFSYNTSGLEIAGAVLLHKVSTGSTVDQITTADLRGQLPGAGARAVQDNLAAHLADNANPHKVNAAQAGAVDKTGDIMQGDLNLNKHLIYGGFLPPGNVDCKQACGIQDDFLCFADKRFTVTQISGSAPVAGSLSYAFDINSENTVRWDTTSTLPVVIEIDFGTQVNYWDVIGVNFIYGRMADSVKIEVYDDVSAQWEVVLDVTGNRDHRVVGLGGGNYVTKIRVTLDGIVDSSSGQIALERIFGFNFHSNGYAWFPRNGGTIHGNILPPDNMYNCGDSSHRWALVRGVTVQSGDLAFEEKTCPICEQEFKSGDVLSLFVKEVHGLGTLTIPMHSVCQGKEAGKTITLKVPDMEDEYIFKEDGTIELVKVPKKQKVQKQVYVIKPGYSFDNKTGQFIKTETEEIVTKDEAVQVKTREKLEIVYKDIMITL